MGNESRLTIIEEFSDYPRKNARSKTRMLKLQCSCGNIIIRPKCAIINGNTKSCGCLNRELAIKRNTKHNLSKHPAYATYKAMQKRCFNPNHRSYKHYGGRGITIEKEWLYLENFLKWCDENNYKRGLQVDRIDNNGNYSPSNCRLVSPKDNLSNTRRNIYKDGLLLKDWLTSIANDNGISFNTLRYRYYSLKHRGYEENDITKNSLINYKNLDGRSTEEARERVRKLCTETNIKRGNKVNLK